MKKITRMAITGALALLTQTVQAQSSVSYSGGTYLQNFDSLPFSNNVSLQANNPITINGQRYTFNGAANAVFDFAAPIDGSGTISGSTGGLGLSSTMPGWYGSGVVAIKYAAHAGGETQGGVTGYGGLTGTDRALGLQSANGSGITTFGFKLVNNTGSTVSNINLSFTAELWRQATAKAMNFGLTVTNSLATMPLSSPTLGSITFASGAAAAVDGNLAGNQTNINLLGVSVGSWQNGDALWLTWQTATATGSSQGIGIDNISIAAVPEPSSMVLVGLGLAGVLVVRRRRRH